MHLKKMLSILVLFFCTHSPATTLPKTIEIKTIGIIPYGMNEQEEISGIYYDFANLIVANAGYNSNNTLAPVARIVKSIKFAHTDLTIMFRYPELEHYVDYIVALPSKPVVVIGLQGKTFENIASLSGKKILYLRGAKFNYLIDNDKTITKYLIKDFITGVKMLLAGKADAIIGSLQSIERASLEVQKTKNTKIILGQPLILENKTPWIQVSKKSHSYLDVEKLKQSFLQLEEDDTFNALKTKYDVYEDE